MRTTLDFGFRILILHTYPPPNALRLSQAATVEARSLGPKRPRERDAIDRGLLIELPSKFVHDALRDRHNIVEACGVGIPFEAPKTAGMKEGIDIVCPAGVEGSAQLPFGAAPALEAGVVQPLGCRLLT